MLNYTFNPVTQVVIENRLFHAPTITLYREDESVRSLPLTQRLVDLLEKSADAHLLEYEESEGDCGSRVEYIADAVSIWYMPSYVFEGLIAKRDGRDWMYLKRLTTIEDVRQLFLECGIDDEPPEEHVGVYTPVDSSEVEDAASHPGYAHPIHVITIVHGRLCLDRVIPLCIDGKLAAVDLF